MLKKILYTAWILILLAFIGFSIKNGSYITFIESMENRTFDIRQNILANSGMKKHSDDIVIIAIDDASYEYILEKYGEWPIPRDIYVKAAQYIEAQNPKSIAFDLLFVKSIKSSTKSDSALSELIKKYDNIFTAINFDNQPQDLRIPEKLPQNLSTVLNNKSDIDFGYLQYSNCRTILSDILYGTSNIGSINVLRNDDGVLRKMPLFIKYQDKFYPQLGLKVALHYLGIKDTNNFDVDKNGNLILSNGKKIKPDKDGSVILNWYGPAGTFENIPFYMLLKAVEENDTAKYDFKDKVVYFGATASSLFDIKTVPPDRVYPGVEVQATYVNNIIDGNLIRKAPACTNVIINIILVLFTVAAVLSLTSMPLALAVFVTVYFLYVIFAYYLMAFFNIWVDIIPVLNTSVIALILTMIVKYLIKSNDYDRQYKLATTDGLTELYNHRFFQEQMQMAVLHAKRYNSQFSVIMIDIDFFKKFNDTYGHQSGDAILRQVSTELKKNVRATDIVCRYGGEEISIILPNTSQNEAFIIADKLRVLISDRKFKLINGKEGSVTISLGVSTYGLDGETPSQLIESADKRLYDAKNSGRNRVN